MREQLKQFIERNIDLIQENTKESWEEIYNEVHLGHTSEFTQVMLEAEIDPAEVLGYIPEGYLKYSQIEKYKIPDNVTSIKTSAFCGCTSLMKIIIPDSVTNIGNYAFCGCSSLISVTILDGVESIGNYAFENCENLTRITIPNSIANIGHYAFAYCKSLTEIRYLGTIEEASTILDNETWIFRSAISKIICIDGEILL